MSGKSNQSPGSSKRGNPQDKLRRFEEGIKQVSALPANSFLDMLNQVCQSKGMSVDFSEDAIAAFQKASESHLKECLDKKKGRKKKSQGGKGAAPAGEEMDTADSDENSANQPGGSEK